MNFKTNVVLFVLLSALFVGTFASNDDDDDDTITLDITWSQSSGNREVYRVMILNNQPLVSGYRNTMVGCSYSASAVGSTAPLNKDITGTSTNVSDSLPNLQAGVYTPFYFSATHANAVSGSKIRVSFNYRKYNKRTVYSVSKVIALSSISQAREVEESELVARADVAVVTNNPGPSAASPVTFGYTTDTTAIPWSVRNTGSASIYKVVSNMNCVSTTVNVPNPYTKSSFNPAGQTVRAGQTIAVGNSIGGTSVAGSTYTCTVYVSWATTSTGAAAQGSDTYSIYIYIDASKRMVVRSVEQLQSASQSLIFVAAAVCGVAVVAAVASVAAAVTLRRRVAVINA